jgi:hypothetical protein
MPTPTTSILLNSTDPAAPAGCVNVKFQTDGGSPLASITANVELDTGLFDAITVNGPATVLVNSVAVSYDSTVYVNGVDEVLVNGA